MNSYESEEFNEYEANVEDEGQEYLLTVFAGFQLHEQSGIENQCSTDEWRESLEAAFGPAHTPVTRSFAYMLAS